MYVIKNDLGIDRLGISVSKKVGNSVVRHRIAGLFRESFRLSLEKFHSGWDIVVVARQAAKGKSFYDINSAFLQLAEQHDLIKNEKNIHKAHSFLQKIYLSAKRSA